MQRSEGRRLRLWALLAMLVLGLAVLGAACGDDDDGDSSSEASSPAAEVSSAVESVASEATSAAESVESEAESAVSEAESEATEAASSEAAGTGGSAAGEPLKVGILSDCEGAFASFYEVDIAGAQLALIQKGATAKGKPSDGLDNATVAGRPIEIVGYGCADDTADKAIEETRRLVEQLGAEILIGPLSGDEGIAVANYALEHPEVTFLNGTSGAQDTTLKVQAPNFFRFNSDGAQWSAGLGDYAYNTLGWKTAAIIGDDYSFPYTSLAGFVAEFCALGGEVTSRVWPALGETDYSSFIAQIPEDVDGVMVGIGGAGLVTFIKQYEEERGKIDGKKFMGNVFWPDPVVLKEIGAQLEGGVAAGPTAGDSTDQKAVDYAAAYDAAYPDQAGTASSVFAYNYYNAMLAMIAGLEAVNGDLSDGHAAFREALSGLTIDGAYGQITLDDNRNAITDNYVQQVVKTDDGYGVKTMLKVSGVDQAFGGVFTKDTPSPDRDNPKCEKLDTPPPWIGNAETVDYSAGG
jgi:branched-chain amino acid transport system substrate-binding protein